MKPSGFIDISERDRHGLTYVCFKLLQSLKDQFSCHIFFNSTLFPYMSRLDLVL